MVDKIKKYSEIYFKLVKNDIKSQVSYKLDFYSQLIIWSIYTFLPFLTISLLFSRVERIGEWDIYAISIMYGIVGVAYDSARMFGRGFDSFEKFLINGDLDVFFIRPLSIRFQIYSSRFFIRRVAGILQYIFILIYGLNNFKTDSIMALLFTIGICIINMFLVFMGLLIIYSSICFLTIKKNFFSEVVVDNVAVLGYYPIEYLNKPIKLIFMYIIPIWFSAFFPMKIALFGSENMSLVLYLVVGFVISLVFFILSNFFFGINVKKYQSVNN